MTLNEERTERQINPKTELSSGDAAPLVSFCVPIYNGAQYLDACLAGICAQTFTNFEILVVDDQSTDNGLAIVRDWASRDPRIFLHINEKNLGLVGNWNRCIELARGQWIKFLFQDDLVEPECLKKMLQVAGSDNGFIACARAVIYDGEHDSQLRQWYDEHETRLERMYSNRSYLTPDEYSSEKLMSPHLNIVGEPSVTLIHRTLFQRFGLFDPLLIQLCDSEMWNRLACNVGVSYVSEKLVSFRVHAASATHANQARKFRARALDEIVEWTRLCTSPHLSGFRRYAKSANEWKPLKRQLLRRINAAYEEARVAALPPSRNQSLGNDIKAVMPLLPGFMKYRALYLLFSMRRIYRTVLGSHPSGSTNLR